MKHISRYAERGSVLFVILIAVVLFAALGYAVSNMMQSGSSGAGINDEKAKLYASEILDSGRIMRQSIQAMRINGCDNTEISFENPIVAGYVNGTNTACQVFHPDGGGMNYIRPDAKWLAPTNSPPTLYQENYFTAAIWGQNIGDATSNDLVYYVPYISKEICLKINEAIGVDNPSGEPPVEGGNGWSTSNIKFVGDYSTGGTQLQRGGAMSGCFEGGGAATTPPNDTYHFFQILIAR